MVLAKQWPVLRESGNAMEHRLDRIQSAMKAEGIAGSDALIAFPPSSLVGLPRPSLDDLPLSSPSADFFKLGEKSRPR